MAEIGHSHMRNRPLSEVETRAKSSRWADSEAALLFLSSLIFLSRLLSHDLGVSVNLTGDHDPAARDIFQELGCGPTLRQGEQTTAFLGLNLAVFCVVHGDFFRVAVDSCIQPLGELFVCRASDSPAL
jgi:hypothetical protein